ncbi:MAG: putative quinol monooxygenase [Solirubrobacteraceae bacterium]
MFTVIARYRTSPSDAQAVADVLARHAAASEGEPGCRQFLVFQAREDPTRFFLVETYDSEAAFSEHRQSEHFKQNIEATLAPMLIEREWHICGALVPARSTTR